ncbi:hypothetical protein GF380_05145 [Candidatus Uhrbacteria bacterium]|nr:hypothetical protein [Candidatus Uhrbacteria bacterium]MBD3284417.1 hypothetical protein [Candidatus Uhrbacteria bacterium]
MSKAVHDDLHLVERRSLFRPRIRYDCGHRAPRFHINAYGERIDVLTRERCGTCTLAYLESVSARCACCGLILTPGDPVAAFILNPEDERDCPPYARIGVGDTPTQLVCLRANDICALGCDLSGWWTEQSTYRHYSGKERVTIPYHEWVKRNHGTAYRTFAY